MLTLALVLLRPFNADTCFAIDDGVHPQAVAADDQEEKARWIQAHRSYKAGVASLAATTQLTHDFIEAVIKDPNAWVAMGQNGTVRTSMISTSVRRTR